MYRPGVVYRISALTIDLVGVFLYIAPMENKNEEKKESTASLLFTLIISIAVVAYGIYLMF